VAGIGGDFMSGN